MTETDIALIRSSFAAIAARRGEATADFYARLFLLAPETRRLFVNDLEAQGAKLMAVLGIVVRQLDDLTPLLPTIDALGARHVVYGVEEHHYEQVGAALLGMLALQLGAAFTPQCRAAWEAAYGVVAGRMIVAARATTAVAA